MVTYTTFVGSGDDDNDNGQTGRRGPDDATARIRGPLAALQKKKKKTNTDRRNNIVIGH